ncbi:MAG: hypothetical protein AAF938_15360, partial [Myxococcota bacterium]
LGGQPTNNLEITLFKDIQIGSTTLNAGDTLETGLDVEAGGLLPVGLRIDGNITCAICHARVDMQTGRAVDGVPNGDVNAAALVAIAPNTASVVGRLGIDLLDPALFDGTGRIIIDSEGNEVELPAPHLVEAAIDDLILQVPPGHFESSLDRISNTTQIPAIWTRGIGPYLFEGAVAIGPFGGLTGVNNSVHSSEINIIATPFEGELLDVDKEYYLGILLQATADPSLSLPDGPPVRPSEWLRQQIPDPTDGELEDQVVAPGVGTFPDVAPTLFTFNGLIWSPDSGRFDLGSGDFLEAANAMSVYQNSLDPPANRSPENQAALASGAVDRGADVFIRAGCVSCHSGPFFNDNQVHPNSLIGANAGRAESRLPLDGVLVPPQLYAFDERVPIRDGARVLDVPFDHVTDDPHRLPFVTRDGGYKTLTLRGVYITAPYMHDGGVGVAEGTLDYHSDGSYSIVDPTGLGIPGTLFAFRPLDAAGSLHAMVDSNLRSAVVAANAAGVAPNQNLEGIGHNFWVDSTTGFTSQEQADLVAFLMALDDNPGSF